MSTRTTDLSKLRSMLESSSLGDEIYSLIRELYPICRSITGEGFRETLGRIRKEIPLEVHEVPSGTQVFDWTVPKEWNIRDAYVKNTRGERVIDFRRHNLHIVNYSVPVHRKMSLAELRTHLHTLPDQPDWIPYRTSYYAETWGFCLSHRQLQDLAPDEYEVVIDSTLKDGAITYGECVLPGQSEEEFLISTHACHPSLANDNLSGLAVAATLDFGRLPPPLHLSLPVRAGHDRRHFLAIPQPSHGEADQARARARLRRRPRGAQLQTQQAAERRYRPGRRACVQGYALRHKRLFAVRLRREAILLARVQSSCGKLRSHTAWRV